jgi:hypothetical protein
MQRKVSITLVIIFLAGVLLGFFVLHNPRIAIPSTFFLGYFLRDMAVRRPAS